MMLPRNAPAAEVQQQRALAPGEFYFVYNPDAPDVRAGIVHACPCGCGQLGALFFRGHGRGRSVWDVTGQWPMVTLSPSIGIKPKDAEGRYHWHGYLRAGMFEEC